MAKFSGNYDSDKFLLYPKAQDAWKCCRESFMRYSRLVDHIEHNHLLYRQEILNNRGENLRVEGAYKYECDFCKIKHFSFHAAITHLIETHVERVIFCDQCIVTHSEQGFHTHICECNIVEHEIQSNGK